MPDLRVPFSPEQCRRLMQKFPFSEVLVQPSPFRSFTDSEYLSQGIRLSEDLSACDIILGIKEVDPDALLENKSYLFFAHVGKQQPHNRHLLQALLKKKNTLIDYEYLTDEHHNRVVAFGRWAGIVGAYNAIRGWGLRNQLFDLKPAWQCYDYKQLLDQLSEIHPGPLRILLTGEGRVASGVKEILSGMNVPGVTPEEFKENSVSGPVYCQLGPQHYTSHSQGKAFNFNEFIKDPSCFRSAMHKYLPFTDMLIAGHFWDPRSPVFFSDWEVAAADFRLSFIADISCDIGGPIPLTLRASTIRSPFYDVDRFTLTEKQAFTNPAHITVMAVDNLPAELPRDASSDFGEALIEKVVDGFFSNASAMMDRATIVRAGNLTPGFSYLADFAAGRTE
ncbi:MAG: NAD(P)-dependent oxidoreductase [Bacteroidales bacterium]